MRKRYKGWLIVSKIEEGTETFYCYTPDELDYPANLRTAEWEAGSIQEAQAFIDNY